MRSWLAKIIILLNGRDLVSCVSEMHAQAALQLDEERVTMITVTFLLPGRLRPREFKCDFQSWVPDDILARYSPVESFAFVRSDREDSTFYIDGEVLSVEELKAAGKHELAQQVISDGAVYAARLRGTDLWAPFFQVTDRVVKTSR